MERGDHLKAMVAKLDTIIVGQKETRGQKEQKEESKTPKLQGRRDEDHNVSAIQAEERSIINATSEDTKETDSGHHSVGDIKWKTEVPRNLETHCNHSKVE